MSDDEQTTPKTKRPRTAWRATEESVRAADVRKLEFSAGLVLICGTDGLSTAGASLEQAIENLEIVRTRRRARTEATR